MTELHAETFGIFKLRLNKGSYKDRIVIDLEREGTIVLSRGFDDHQEAKDTFITICNVLDKVLTGAPNSS